MFPRTDSRLAASKSVVLGAWGVAALILSATSSIPANAEGYEPRSRRSSYSLGSGSDSTATYDLSVAGAVAAPSSAGFIGENPAGLIYNSTPSIQGFIASDKDHPELLSNGISVGAGNGLAAATLGVQSFANATDDRGSITRLNFGLATYAESLGTVIGLSGAYRFTNRASRAVDPGLEATWTANLGLLFNPFGIFRLGLNLYELDKGMTGAAAGVSAKLNSSSVLSIDAGADNRGRGLTVKPGIGVTAGALSLTYAYGMQVDREVRSNIAPGNTIGVGLQATDTVHVVGYYNHFELYSLSVKLRF